MKNQFRRIAATLALTMSLAAAAWAGTSRHAYFDGGQSMDGRYAVLPELVVNGERLTADNWHWQYTWKDARTNKTIVGKLQGLNHGKDRVYAGIHGHIFVSPDGETFAVLNCRSWAPYTSMERKGLSTAPKTSAEFQNFPGFSHRLVIYRKTGEIVKRFDLKDLLRPEEWLGVNPGPGHVLWQAAYPTLSAKTAPRSDYALYRISPDYTVLELMVKPWIKSDVASEGRAEKKPLPEPRAIRVSLTEGRIFEARESLTDVNRIPVQSFVGPTNVDDQAAYVPSLDPVRVPGKFAPVSKSK